MLQGLHGLQGYEGYDAVRKTSAVRDRSDEGRLRVTGPDRAAWLQGLLTNDILAIKPGGGCYAAYLTPQGRMISDVRVLERGDFMLLDVPAAQKAYVLERLTTFIIMEDVAVDDVTESLARVAIHGPGAAAVLESVVKVDDGTPLASLAEHASTVGEFGDPAAAPEIAVHAGHSAHPVVIAGSRELGDATPGFDVYCPAPVKAELLRALAAAGAEPIADAAWHALRIEAGRPLFGVDMTTETIPLEAGIEDRAISFTKGCYVGQEIIIRVMHRGGGRVARKLVGLTPVDGTNPDDPLLEDTPVFSGEKAIGRVTSAAWSPRREQWIAMGYVQRDAAEPGTRVTIGSQTGVIEAVVSALPLSLTA